MERKNEERMYPERTNKERVDGRFGEPARARAVARFSRLPAVWAAWILGRPRIFGLLLVAILAVLLTPTAGAKDPIKPSPAAVWYADGAALVQVDPETGKAIRTVDLPRGLDHVLALSADPADGSVAVVAGGRLLGFDASGNKTFEEKLRGASDLGKEVTLAKDPHDGSLWVGGKGAIVQADAKGKDQRAVKLGSDEVARAVNPTQDGSAWVLSASRLLHVSGDGEVLEERAMPKEGVASPTRLAVDELYAYVANEEEVARVALDEEEREASGEFEISPEGGVGSLAVDPSEGTLYVANQASLSSYDSSGRKQKAVDLAPYGAGEARAASFDAPSRTLWVRVEEKVLGFSEGLDEIRAEIKARKQGEGVIGGLLYVVRTGSRGTN